MVALARAQLALPEVDLSRWSVLARILPPEPARRAPAEQLPLVWAPPARRPAIVPPAPAPSRPLAPVVLLRRRGGPDPARPCEGCAERRVCRPPGCELLSSLLSPEELVVSQEISSPALMAGRGVDEAFYVLHEALRDPDAEVEHWPDVAAQLLPQLRPWIEQLPGAQREIMMALLEGKSRAQVTHERHISRQSIHKTYWRAHRALLARIEAHLRAHPVPGMTLPRGS